MGVAGDARNLSKHHKGLQFRRKQLLIETRIEERNTDR